MNLLEELPDNNSVYFSDVFHNVMLSHFPNIKLKVKFELKEVSGVNAEIYRGDFHGLLNSFRVPFDYHRVNTEFNGLLSPQDYLGDLGTIKIIDYQYLERLATVFRAVM